MKKVLGIFMLFFLIAENAFAKCKKEDFVNYIDTSKGCIALDPYKKPEKIKRTYSFLHGDGGYSK